MSSQASENSPTYQCTKVLMAYTEFKYVVQAGPGLGNGDDVAQHADGSTVGGWYLMSAWTLLDTSPQTGFCTWPWWWQWQNWRLKAPCLHGTGDSRPCTCCGEDRTLPSNWLVCSRHLWYLALLAANRMLSLQRSQGQRRPEGSGSKG